MILKNRLCYCTYLYLYKQIHQENMSSRRNHACYQMLSYTGYRFLYFLAKASKHIVAWLSVESLAVWRELFVPAGFAQLSAECGSLLLVFVCMAVAPRSQPLALSIVPTRDTSSPQKLIKIPAWL